MRGNVINIRRFQSRHDLQGVKTAVLSGVMVLSRCLPKQTRSSGGQNLRAADFERAVKNFQSRPDLQGVKTGSLVPLVVVVGRFQSRPDLQGVKTMGWAPQLSVDRRLPKQTRSSGGQNATGGPEIVGSAFQSRPDLQGVKTRQPHQPANRDNLPKQTRSSGGQNVAVARRSRVSATSKADPIFRGSNREGPWATSGGPIDAKPIVNE